MEGLNAGDALLVSKDIRSDQYLISSMTPEGTVAFHAAWRPDRSNCRHILPLQSCLMQL